MTVHKTYALPEDNRQLIMTALRVLDLASIQELADYLGVSHQSVSQLFRSDSKPTTTNLLLRHLITHIPVNNLSPEKEQKISHLGRKFQTSEDRRNRKKIRSLEIVPLPFDTLTPGRPIVYRAKFPNQHIKNAPCYPGVVESVAERQAYINVINPQSQLFEKKRVSVESLFEPDKNARAIITERFNL